MAHARIGQYNCTLYLDYDCQGEQILKKLSPDEKIMWLELRMQMIFLRPLRQLYDVNSCAYRALHDPEGSPPMTHLFLCASAVMNGIEALGSFLTPPKKSRGASLIYRVSQWMIGRGENREFKPNKPNFLVFIRRYMPDWNVSVKSPYYGKTRLSEVLWKAYRNGLAHSFAIEHASLEDLHSEARFEVSNNLVRIDGSKFFADFIKATGAMFEDVRTDPVLRNTFVVRFDEVYHCD